MAWFLLPSIAALVACNPPPKEATMRNPSPAENAASDPRGDSPAEAEGRRTLSTAFVRVGPDGHLTVELRDGRAIVLRDVVMRPGDFCGVQVLGGSAGRRYCGGYGEIAAARPGGAPAPGAPDPASLDPAEPGRAPVKGE